MDILMPYANVTVFYGHIHHEERHMTGHIAHRSARSLIFPLPMAGSQERRTPLPWNPASRDHGLGFRQIQTNSPLAAARIQEFAPDGTKT